MCCVDELQTAAEQHGDGVIAIPLDVTSAEQWRSAVDATVDRFGSLSTLVNNAGVLHRASVADETPAGFEMSWRVNCLGPFLGIRAALEHLRRADGAAIVNTCSTGAIRPFPNHAAYGSSKWALRGLTQITAAELAPAGIRVNAVFPGPIETPMLDAATQSPTAAPPAVASVSRWKWRTPSPSWCPSTRRSSPAPNSSSTADNACGSDEPMSKARRWESSAPAQEGWRWGSS